VPHAEDTSAAALERLGVLVGQWTLEAAFPEAPPSGPIGRMVVEWLLGGRFLAQRTQAPDPAPDSFAVIGVDPEGGGYR
jgi:hypothetical protein